jgi:hypothetical protein
MVMKESNNRPTLVDICGWLVHNQRPWLAIGKEFNEKMFLVHIPSILQSALVGAASSL